MVGGEQVGWSVSAWHDLSRVHSATLLGMLQFVVYEVVAASQGVSLRINSVLTVSKCSNTLDLHVNDIKKLYHSIL